MNTAEYMNVLRKESISGQAPTTITSAEKGLIIYKILTRMKYGSNLKEYGLTRLCKEKIICDYFILHEGSYEWTESGSLTDRQLLAKYWGNFKCWYKAQPMFLIEKYYGPEYAFYFAWMEHYIKMLIIPAILSIFILIYGISVTFSDWNVRSKEICQSEQIMCPKCHYLKCKFERLKSTCMMAYITSLFDNRMSIMFSVFVSLWSTVFMEYWQRRQAELQLQWNVKDLPYDTVTRPEYVTKARKVRYLKNSNIEYHYIPLVDKCVSYTVTTTTILLMLTLVLAAVLGVMIYRITVNVILLRRSEDKIIVNNRHIIASVTGACISATFIIIFKKLFDKLSFWLTEIENHRTQYEFDNAYILKGYGLAFVNNYAAVIYIAFFKGKFFTHPGDMGKWEEFGGLGSDICDANGCIVDLSIQLITIMVFKAFMSHGLQNFIPVLRKKFSHYKLKVNRETNLTFYEEEFFKPNTGHYFLIEEYQDMVIQYGFVVFFVAGFPLAPLLAFINNIFEVRTDASKITKSFRRPICNKVTGIGAWFGILQAITYVGVVFNAFVIAFTSMFVELEVYTHTKHRLETGFYNFTISAYNISDFVFARKHVDLLGHKLCFYPGMRYPPNHPEKYQLTPDYWFVLTMRFVAIVIFEHLVIFVKGILAYAIPDVPENVVGELARKRESTRLS
ncbi:anoctamin-4-like isoform X2 [Diorhabda carinulata]|uniref:anoctamin-4-like isoform X2 n=1 Tax=Diorhabda carinulata TaxID=1163345 RepID=UPI0025A08C88|nr:anoctamin-4-like isoform X2 [Diorhabda carinulata]